MKLADILDNPLSTWHALPEISERPLPPAADSPKDWSGRMRWPQLHKKMQLLPFGTEPQEG